MRPTRFVLAHDTAAVEAAAGHGQQAAVLGQAAALIDATWPAQRPAQAYDLGGAPTHRGLPCSVLGLQDVSPSPAAPRAEVVAHARLLPVAGHPSAVLLESVVVAPALQGGGLGRRLMAASEAHALAVNRPSVHLATRDKASWYARLGYQPGPRVQALGAKAAAHMQQGPDRWATDEDEDTSLIWMHKRLLQP